MRGGPGLPHPGGAAAPVRGAAHNLKQERLNTVSPQFIYFFQTLLNGLAVGSMYSMIAVGYSMVYCLLNRVNFAHGDLYVFGTFVAFSLMTILPVPAAILLACMFAGLIGMTIERTVYRPVRDAFRLVPMISALGAALVLRTIAQIVWGTEAIAFRPCCLRASLRSRA